MQGGCRGVSDIRAGCANGVLMVYTDPFLDSALKGLSGRERTLAITIIGVLREQAKNDNTNVGSRVQEMLDRTLERIRNVTRKSYGPDEPFVHR